MYCIAYGVTGNFSYRWMKGALLRLVLLLLLVCARERGRERDETKGSTRESLAPLGEDDDALHYILEQAWERCTPDHPERR